MRTLDARKRKLLRDADRRLRAARDAGPDSADGELNIVPFLDVVVNLIMFLLMTVTATLALAEVPVRTPGTADPARPVTQHTPAGEVVPLVVHLGTDGLHVFANGQRLASGCAAPGADGATIPLVAGTYDWLALRGCAASVAAGLGPAAATGQPGQARPHAVMLSAVPDATYDDVVHAMDALRGTPSMPLFDDVRWVAAGAGR